MAVNLGTAEGYLDLNITKFVNNLRRAKEEANGTAMTASKALTEKFTTAGESMVGVGRKMTKTVTLPIVAMGAAAFAMNTKFDTALAKVSTIADTSQVSMKSFRSEILKTSNDTGKSVTTISEALYQAISAGVKTKNAMGFVNKAVKLSEGGFTDLTTSVDLLTTVLNAYNMKTSQTSHVSDVLISTQNYGKTTVDELSQTMGKTIPTAKAYGVSIEDLCTQYGILTRSGIKTRVATTYINSMFNELGKSSTKVSKVLKQETGKSFDELTKSGKSTRDVLAILQQHCKKTGTKFTDLWSNVNAGRAALTLAGKSTKEYSSVLDMMTHSNGKAGEAFEKMENTVQEKFNKVLNSGKVALIQFGETMKLMAIPFINTMVKVMHNLANGISNMSDWQRRAIVRFAMFAAAIGPVLVGTGKLLITIGQLNKYFPSLGRSANSVISALGRIKLSSVGLVAILATVGIAVGTLIAKWIKAHNRIIKDYENDVKTRENTIKSVRKEGRANDFLLARLSVLSQKHKKTKAEKEEENSIVQRLNKSVHGLNLKYDESSDKLSKNVSEIRKKIKAENELAVASAYEKQKEEVLNKTISERVKLDQLQSQKRYLKEKIKEAEVKTRSGTATQYEINKLNDYRRKLSGVNDKIRQHKKVLSDANKEYKRISFESLISKAKAAGVKVPKVLADGLRKGGSKLPQTMKELKNALKFEKIIKNAGAEGKKFTKSLMNGVISGKLTVKQAGEKLNKLMKENNKKMANTSKAGGKKVTSTFATAYVQGMNRQKKADANAGKSVINTVISVMKKAAIKVKNVAVAFINWLAGGIRGGVSRVAAAVHSVVSRAIGALRGIISAAISAGANFVRGFINGIRSKVGGVFSAVAGMVHDAINTLKGAQKSHSPARELIPLGEQFVEGYIKGIESEQSEVITTINNLVTNAINAMKMFSEKATGKDLFKVNIGEEMAEDVISGIANEAAKLTLTIKKLSDIYLKSAQVTLRKKKKHNIKVKEEEAKHWERVLKATRKGSKKYKKVVKKVSSEKDSLKHLKKMHGMSLNQEANYWKGFVNKAKKGTNAYKAAVVKLRNLQKKQALDSITTEKNRLELMKRYNNVSISTEIKYWENILGKTKRGTLKYKAVVEQLASLKNSLSSKILETAETKLSDFKQYNDMTLQEEIDFWQKIKSYLKSGTDAYKEANLKVLELQKNLNDELQGLDKNYRDNFKEITTSLIENIQSVENEYNEAISSRRDSLVTAMSLFEKFSSSTILTSSHLIQALQSQVTGLREWDENLSKIASRNAPKELLDQLESMSPEYLAQIKLLANMTDAQWDEYIALWNEKTKIATERATKEVKIDEYSKRINDLIKQADDDINNLTQSYADDLAKLGVTIEDQSYDLGSSIIDGIRNGLNGEYKGIITSLKGIMSNVESALKHAISNVTTTARGEIVSSIDAMIRSVKNELGIASESKVFKNEIGKNIPLGLYKGFEQAMPQVVNSILRLVRGMVAEVKSLTSEPYIPTGDIKNLGYIKPNEFTKIHNEDINRRVDINKSTAKGDTFIFNSPKPIDEVEAAHQLKKVKREIAQGF